MSEAKKIGYVFIGILVITIVLSISVLFKQIDSKLTGIEIKENEITISNNTYNIKDIVDIELLDKISISDGVGSNTPNTSSGRYTVNEEYEAKVYVHKNKSPFIRISFKDSNIVFNEDNKDKTIEIYNELVELIK